MSTLGLQLFSVRVRCASVPKEDLSSMIQRINLLNANFGFGGVPIGDDRILHADSCPRFLSVLDKFRRGPIFALNHMARVPDGRRTG